MTRSEQESYLRSRGWKQVDVPGIRRWRQPRTGARMKLKDAVTIQLGLDKGSLVGLSERSQWK